jgi:hypothetical protein
VRAGDVVRVDVEERVLRLKVDKGEITRRLEEKRKGEGGGGGVDGQDEDKVQLGHLGTRKLDTPRMSIQKIAPAGL